MPLAMLPDKSLQHCQEHMIRAIFGGNAIGNVANQKSTTLT